MLVACSTNASTQELGQSGLSTEFTAMLHVEERLEAQLKHWISRRDALRAKEERNVEMHQLEASSLENLELEKSNMEKLEDRSVDDVLFEEMPESSLRTEDTPG
ncbi:MAG: hypothetical protein SGPRY_009265 [Prymnesium sp.]